MAVGQQVRQGFALQDSEFIAGLAQGQNASFATLTAHAGGLAPLATPIPPAAALINIGTVATAADSLLLPFAVPGQIKFINNNTATSARIFAQTANNRLTAAADTITFGPSGGATTAATQFDIAANVRVIFFCSVAGLWNVIQSA